MKRVLAAGLLSVCGAQFAPGQTIETQPLDAPIETPDQDSSSRFQRAPFKTYLERVGPSLPQQIDQGDMIGHDAVLLRQLDKMTGGIQTLQIR
ncbi:MAG: hypothetical protein AAF501_16830, partial [Pseudomonadota bacterium]